MCVGSVSFHQDPSFHRREAALLFMLVKQDMSTGAPVSTAIALADGLEVLVAVAGGLFHSGGKDGRAPQSSPLN